MAQSAVVRDYRALEVGRRRANRLVLTVARYASRIRAPLPGPHPHGPPGHLRLSGDSSSKREPKRARRFTFASPRATHQSPVLKRTTLRCRKSAWGARHCAILQELMIEAARRWWRRARRVRRVTEAPSTESTESVGSNLKAGELVIVGPADSPKWALLGCPCRCGEMLWVNLMLGHARHRLISRGPSRPVTLTPSLDVATCGSHFWVREGAVIWV